MNETAAAPNTPDLRWFLLISIVIHALLLAWYVVREPQALWPIKTRLLPDSFRLATEQPSAPAGQVRAVQGKSSSQEKTGESSASAAGGERTASIKAGGSFPEGGTLSAGVEGSSDTSGISAGGEATSSTGIGKSSGAGGISGDAGKTSSAERGSSSTSTPIPELPQYFYYSYDGYFVEIDHYELEGMHIPGTELCIAGDRLRTKRPMTFAQRKTDYSKCRIKTRADTEIEICPPEATTEAVIFSGYLTSPLAYHINTCREYDTSHCRILRGGTDKEREYCKVDFKYEGVWATGTIFEYKCTSSEVVTYRHPLVYNIRYLVEYERNDRYRSREVHRISQSIPKCD